MYMYLITDLFNTSSLPENFAIFGLRSGVIENMIKMNKAHHPEVFVSLLVTEKLALKFDCIL